MILPGRVVRYEGTIYRPPSEARSYILQVLQRLERPPELQPGDPIRVELPPPPHRPLEPV